MDKYISRYLAEGVVLDNKYTIVRHLASGGFGNTYLATDRMGKSVVVKEFYLSGVCTRDADSRRVSITIEENKALYHAQRTKFIKEAQRIYALSHPHIVKVSDLFEENGTAYYVMDYIEGQSLAQMSKPLAEPLVMHYLNQILSALEFVHSHGILHLDIKPNNIMVDNQGNAILIDFGASKQYDADSTTHSVLTTTTGVAYTPGYAPFEQMSNQYKSLGTHSDIYSLGATLYNLLTGLKPPLPSDILENGIPHLELLSPQMRVVVESAMKVSARDRIKTIGQLKSVLNNTSATIINHDVETRQVYNQDQTEINQHGSNINKNREEKSSSGNIVLILLLIVLGVFIAFVCSKSCGGSETNANNSIAVCDSAPIEIMETTTDFNFSKDKKTSESNTSTSSKITTTKEKQDEERNVTSNDGDYYYTGTFTDLEGVVKPVSLRFTSKNGKIINCVYKNEELGGKIRMTGNWTSNGCNFKGKDGRLNFTMTLTSVNGLNNHLVGHAYVGEKYLDVELNRVAN